MLDGPERQALEDYAFLTWMAEYSVTVKPSEYKSRKAIFL